MDRMQIQAAVQNNNDKPLQPVNLTMLFISMCHFVVAVLLFPNNKGAFIILNVQRGKERETTNPIIYI